MSTPILHNWSVYLAPYKPPVEGFECIVGDVYGHPNSERHPDGKTIQTSSLVGAKGRTVTTRAGSTYRLGRIDPKYRRWMRKQGIAYDRHQPVKARERAS